MHRSLPAALLLAAIAFTGCAGGHAPVAGPTPGLLPSTSPTPPATSSPTPAPKPSHSLATHAPPSTHAPASKPSKRAAPRPAVRVTPTKMLVFVEENHSQSQALSGMPYLSSLAHSYGRATAYHAETHPSLPNYLALAGGSTFGVHDDDGPGAHPLSGDSVFDQALTRGRSAKSYVESMPANCAQSSRGDYAVKHNPWAYFSDPTQRANCRRLDVPMGTPSSGALAADVAAGALPNIGMAVPNLCNDAHDCSLSTADNWLRQRIPRVMAGPDYRAGRLAIVVTFDEDDRNAGNNVATVVISPRTQHLVATSSYDHYSWLRCADEMAGAPLLRNASTARSLCPAFGL